MKTIKIYLLLILFFNVFSDGEISDISSSDINNLKIPDSGDKDSPQIPDSGDKDSPQIPDSGDKDSTYIPDSGDKDSPQIPDSGDKDSTHIPDSGDKDSPQIPDSGDKDSPQIPDSGDKDSPQIPDSGDKDSPQIPDTKTPKNFENSDSVNVNPPSNSSETNARPTIVLIGFGQFKRPRINLATFRVFFKKYIIKLAAKLLYFTVNINYLRRLRILEEQKANCTLVTEEDNDDMAYDCNVPISEDKDFIMSANDDFEFVGLDPNFKFSSYANKTRKAINNQTSEYVDIMTLSDATLTTYDNTFIINGVLDDELNDKQVILSFDEDGKGDLTNATCKVNNTEGSNYQLDCTSSKRLKAHLDGVMGKTSTKPLLILKKEGEEDLVDVDSTPYKYGAIGKKSSGGLSSGGVAGIIIACCVALIAALIAGYFCSKQTRPPMEPTALPMNSSNSIQNAAY